MPPCAGSQRSTCWLFSSCFPACRRRVAPRSPLAALLPALAAAPPPLLLPLPRALLRPLEAAALPALGRGRAPGRPLAWGVALPALVQVAPAQLAPAAPREVHAPQHSPQPAQLVVHVARSEARTFQLTPSASSTRAALYSHAPVGMLHQPGTAPPARNVQPQASVHDCAHACCLQMMSSVAS